MKKVKDLKVPKGPKRTTSENATKKKVKLDPLCVVDYNSLDFRLKAVSDTNIDQELQLLDHKEEIAKIKQRLNWIEFELIAFSIIMIVGIIIWGMS